MKSVNYEDLIGIPFVNCGRMGDDSGGLDCFGLFEEIMKRQGIIVPDYKISCFATLKIEQTALAEIKQHWLQIEEPEVGCAVAMALNPIYPKVIQHLGVCVSRDRVMHTLKGVGSYTFPIFASYWLTKIKGYYRWIG